MSDEAKDRRTDAKSRFIRLLALAIAGFIGLIGAAFFVVPEILIATGRQLVSPGGLIAAAALRAFIGATLILAARGSRAPGTLRAIGVVVLVMGLVTPFFGVDAAHARLDWEAAHIGFLRIEGAAFVVLGAVIVSVLRPAGQSSRVVP